MSRSTEHSIQPLYLSSHDRQGWPGSRKQWLLAYFYAEKGMKTSWNWGKQHVDSPPSNFQEIQRSEFVCLLHPAILSNARQIWEFCSSLHQDKNFFGGKETTHLTAHPPISLLCGTLNSWLEALSKTLSRSRLSAFANCSCNNQYMCSEDSRGPTGLTLKEFDLLDQLLGVVLKVGLKPWTECEEFCHNPSF